jgi:hypothetical protein
VVGEELEVGGENEGNTDPSTRFAPSREASFLNSRLSLEDFFGDLSRGRGCRWAGPNPAGSRVICIECGRGRLGGQGGEGNLADSSVFSRPRV